MNSLKPRPELEAEAMRLIRVVNENIVLDAKEVLVRSLDQMWVDGAKWAADVSEEVLERKENRYEYATNVSVKPRLAIYEALENRERI